MLSDAYAPGGRRLILSSEDLEPGTRWNAVISRQLQSAKLGIFCFTPESQISPWMLFEAGAVAKSLQSRTYAYLFGLKKRELISPWNEFQASEAIKEDTRLLIHSLNKRLGTDALGQPLLDKAFNRGWAELDLRLRDVREVDPPGRPQLIPRSELLDVSGQDAPPLKRSPSVKPELFRVKIENAQQVTIPRSMLDALYLREGDELEFVIRGKQIQLTRAVKVIPSHLFTPEVMAFLHERQNPKSGNSTGSDLGAALRGVKKGRRHAE